jgi:hypothetical protein
MYGKPIKRGDNHIYHLPKGYIIKVVIAWAFGIIAMVLMMWGIWENDSVFDLEFILMLIGVIGLCMFMLCIPIYAICGIGLTISPNGGVFRCKGYRIEFKWDDVKRIDYLLNNPSKRKPSYQLSLILNGKQQVKREKVQLWFVYNLIPILFRFDTVPVGVVFRHDIIGLDQRPPSRDEMLGFLEYFVKTPIGEDLLRYIPHIFRIPKHRYFDIPDSSD